ncbi:MAG: class I SAM-dependent methyltransferase [Chloroflexota bacterium]
MNLLARLLRTFFHLLYHPFAWTYDLVAWVVSFGRWKDWVRSVTPFLEGTRILELGHGPGHLQRILLDLGLLSFGLDESPQMGRLAHIHLYKSGYTQTRLARGLAQALPYASGSFDTLVSTFPTEYIFDPRTLLEARRTLNNGGRLIVLPVAWITGKNALDHFLSWLFKVTGQAPSDALEVVATRLAQPFENAGFQVEIRRVEVRSSLLLFVVARK